jgi:hypothetical protein
MGCSNIVPGLVTCSVPYPAPKGKTWKTDGQSNWVLVDDPYYINNSGLKIKRRKRSNITPPKKKRK